MKERDSREQEPTEYPEEERNEANSDLDSEIRAGEWQSLRRFVVYRRRSRQGKIIATYQAVSNRLTQLEKMFYSLVRNNPQKSEKLLWEIKKLRLIQEVLLQCLIWEPRGELNKDMVPDEVWELID